MVQEGDPAPDFALPDADGNIVKLSSFSGRFTVIYFYPKDNTSGCTKEALDFSALKPEFEKLGAKVIGISPDGAKSHEKFRTKHALDVTLLSDERKLSSKLSASGRRRRCTVGLIWAWNVRPSSSALTGKSPSAGAASKFQDTPRRCSMP